MSNGSKKLTSTNVGKSYIVDYRNAKYQGELTQYQRLPHGMGILLTVDYQLIIAHWNYGQINGQCALVDADGSIFYGNISNNVLQGTNVFEISKHKTIYSFHREQEHTLAIIDNHLRRTLTTIKVNTSDINRLLSVKRKMQIQIFDDLDLNPTISNLQSKRYTTNDEKWQIISTLSGQSLANQLKGFKQFVKFNFNSKITPKDKKLEIIQTKQYLQIRCKKAGIVARIQESGTNRVKLLGYFDNYENQMDIYLKSKGGIENQTQQFCQGHTIVYGKSRNQACKANLFDYYRKSTNFVNRFIQCKYLLSIKKLYQTLHETVQSQLSIKQAQQQLQLGYNESTNEVNQEKTMIQHHTSSQMELQQIKNEVYNRVNKRKESSVENRSPYKRSLKVSRFDHNRSHSRFQYQQNDDYLDGLPKKYRLSNFQNKYSQNSYENQSRKYKKYTEESNFKYPKEYLKYTQNSPERNKYNKDQDKVLEYSENKYTYLDNNKNKYNLNLDLKKLPKERVHFPQNKFKQHQPFPKEQIISPFHNQSLDTLAKNYEHIENVLKRQKSAQSKRKYRNDQVQNVNTPTSRSPSRYNYLKSSEPSPVGTPGRSKRQWR